MAIDVQHDGGSPTDESQTPQMPSLVGSPSQEQMDVHIEVNADLHQRSVRSGRSWASPARPTRAYHFTVHMPISAAARKSQRSTPLPAVAEPHRANDEFFAADNRSPSLEERISIRDQRVSRYKSQRRLPALVSPRFLPSFNLVKDALEVYQEGVVQSSREELKRKRGTPVEPQEPQSRLLKLMTPTVSKERKQRTKRNPLELLPFLSSVSSNKDRMIERRPALYDDEYDSAEQARREANYSSKSRFVHGAFLPPAAKPKSPSPLLSRRAHTAARSPKPPGSAVSSRSAAWSSGSFSGTPGSRIRRAPSTAASVQEVDEVEELPSISSTFRVSQHSPSFSLHKRGSPGSRSFAGHHRSTLHHRSILQKQRSTLGHSRTSALTKKNTTLLTRSLTPVKDKTSFAIPILEKPEEGSLVQESQALTQKQQDKSTFDDLSHQVFKRYSDEGKIHQDDMTKIMEAVGYACPDKTWIAESFSSITKFVTIGYDEFLRFINLYEEQQRKHARTEFDRFDSDASGEIDLSELSLLMRKLSIEPMKHVLQEIVAEVDKDGTGTMNFQEFELVMKLVRTREGFTKDEYEEISTLFQRFDRDGSGAMNTREVEIGLQWLGFNFTAEGLTKILEDIDEDGSGYIDCQEWLRCMRKVRDYKIANLQEIIALNDFDGDGTITQSELKSILRCVGYVPDVDAVRECAEDAGIDPEDNDLDISELWRLLANYRAREGLSNMDLSQIEDAFLSRGKGGNEEVDIVDIGKIIRSIGYTLSFEMQQNLTNKVDIDCSGKLDMREFRKMIRLMHQQDTDLFKMAFDEALGTDPHRHIKSSKKEVNSLKEATQQQCQIKFGIDHFGKSITLDEAVKALRRVSCTDNKDTLKEWIEHEALATDEVDFYAFSQAALRSRQKQRAQFRENGGFTKEEVEELRRSFSRHDSDGSGQISGQEITHLMEDEFPMLTKDPQRRPQMIQLLNEADVDGSGTLDFGDFLRIMRHLRDIQDQLKIGKELEAVSSTKFSPPEVAEFRELFLATGGGETELGFEQVRDLLKCIVPMGTKNVEELQVKFYEFSAQQMGVLGGADLLDFPEFLWLMRELVDMNFAGMNDAANAMAESS